MGSQGGGTLPRREVITMEYILKVPKEGMEHISDMLRFESCFSTEEGEDYYLLHTLSYTRDRWVSFDCLPEVVSTRTMGREAETAAIDRARGFLEGMNFAKKIAESF